MVSARRQNVAMWRRNITLRDVTLFARKLAERLAVIEVSARQDMLALQDSLSAIDSSQRLIAVHDDLVSLKTFLASVIASYSPNPVAMRKFLDNNLINNESLHGFDFTSVSEAALISYNYMEALLCP